MATYYAWSNFPRGVDENGTLRKPITVGKVVTQEKLGVDDEDWQILIANGSIRTMEYPKAVMEQTYGDSPNRYYKDLLAKAAAADMAGPNLSSDELDELKSVGIIPGEAETDTDDEAAVEERSLRDRIAGK